MSKRILSLLVAIALWGCANGSGTPTDGTGGTTAAGGGSGGAATTGSGGSSTGGNGTGGSGTGGIAPGTGGAAPGTGGRTEAGGHVGTGGAPGAGGASSTGGSGGVLGSGGAAGMRAGGTGGAGGAGFAALPFSYWLGVDISFTETQSVALRASLLSLLQAHGINSVRLRTFVDPTAADGYSKSGACGLADTIDFGKQIKAAGMGFLVDFHYSDNWADPGKQCVPIKWQSYTTIADLAAAMKAYTKDAITQLIAGGARPDMVQIGNETTPGILIHKCDSSGSPTGTNPVNGSTSNWANTGALLKAGVEGVKEVDPTILTSFHIAQGGDHVDGTSALSKSVTWLSNALKYTTVDAFGESCYWTYQGDSSSASHSKMIWQTTEGGVAAKFPNIKIFAAEYGGAEREINDVIYGLPNQQGLGTFFWEATMGTKDNNGPLATQSGNAYVAGTDLSLYDLMKAAYASRL
ncbi:MAG TPA: glycosyl hydrolase 53 family protein [Opitutaceae bacterium]|nr:glycosyl hydrolase 53 family protein [Opitutaceae bacterium]